ncbi:hypothetical protein A3N57_21015 [Enterobacter cloacae subsp. dissolvens]|nr:hypothetical protein A3N57_21015 [Enterobacter cloacae subsp. dissolvens]
MTYVIVHALAPIFVIMLLGFWAGKAKMVDNKNVSLLNIFVMDFALPAALFSATVQTPWTGIVAQSPLILRGFFKDLRGKEIDGCVGDPHRQSQYQD